MSRKMGKNTHDADAYTYTTLTAEAIRMSLFSPPIYSIPIRPPDRTIDEPVAIHTHDDLLKYANFAIDYSKDIASPYDIVKIRTVIEYIDSKKQRQYCAIFSQKILTVSYTQSNFAYYEALLYRALDELIYYANKYFYEHDVCALIPAHKPNTLPELFRAFLPNSKEPTST